MPEVTDKYIRIPIRKRTSGNVRTIDISKKEGIKALVEIINGKTRIITYLFLVNKWNIDDAKEWVSKHKTNSSLGYKVQLDMYKQLYLSRS